MAKSKHLLVLRFSAMGDVALTIPALQSVLEAYPEVTITFLTRPFFASFVPSHPRLNVVGIDVGKHNGFWNLRKLAKSILEEHQFDEVIDLHSVLRSRVLTSYFRFKRMPVTTFKKKRNERRSILSHRSSKQLPHIIEQYLNTFRLAGYDSKLISGPWVKPVEEDELSEYLEKREITTKSNKWIGIAPFATHEEKIWGLNHTAELIKLLRKKDYTVFLFGGGGKEIDQLSKIENRENKVFSAAGKIPFNQELVLMNKLDFMISMDTSNMHFSSLLKVPVISIWGGTTPLLGFYPYGYQYFMIQVPKSERKQLTLSAYGKKKATNGYNWREHISVDEIMKLID